MSDPDLVPAELELTDETPFAPRFDDVYFSRAGGWDESRHVFLDGNDLPARWQSRDRFVIAETGFGTGLNFLVAATEFLGTAPPQGCLHYLSVEKHPLEPVDLERCLRPWIERAPVARELIARYPVLAPGTHRLGLAENRVRLTLLFGEAARQLGRVPVAANGWVDAWFLDGFSPSKNPDLWSDSVFRAVARLTRRDGTLATFTSAGAVRRGLNAVGFETRKVPGFGRKRDMTVGVLRQRPETMIDPWFDVFDEPTAAKNSVAVIGAGLAGAAAAATLAGRGHAVTLFDEASRVASGASGNPSGTFHGDLLLENNFRERFYTAAHDLLVRRLEDLENEGSFWHRCGVLHPMLPDNASRLREIASRRRTDPRQSAFLTADAATAASGIAFPHPARFEPSGGWLDPPQFCQHLVESHPGRIEFRPDLRIESLQATDHGWRLLGPDHEVIAEVAIVVLANAEDAQRLAPVALPLRSVRGQLTFLPVDSRTAPLRSVVQYGGYVTPAHLGRHTVGATFQPDDTDLAHRDTDDQANLAALDEALPHFRNRSTGASAGRVAIRAVTLDHLPLVGPVPDPDRFLRAYDGLRFGRFDSGLPASPRQPGLYVSAGHGSRGIVTAMIAAELLADLIESVPLPVEQQVLEHLLPARFLVRALKRNQPL